MPKSVEILLDRALTEISEEEDEILFTCMSKAMRMAKKDVINNSPVGKSTKHYKDGWAVRTKRLRHGFEGVIYNKTHPGLTHLLNNGHIVKNQYGTYDRKEGDNHITNARDRADEYLINLLVEAHS